LFAAEDDGAGVADHEADAAFVVQFELGGVDGAIDRSARRSLIARPMNHGIVAAGGTLLRQFGADAIAVITNLISHFPPGRFDLGFPRPIGGDNNFDASADVFFPVPDKATAHLAFLGHLSRPMSAMLEPARSQVTAAMARTSAHFAILYPDGLDHLHVKAY